MFHPLNGDSFLKSLCKTIREGFTDEEIHDVYANKILQHFDRPSILVHYLPEIETPAYNDYALRRITFDIVCFSGKINESTFQSWSMKVKNRLAEILRWIDVEGVKHRYRSYEFYIEQGQYMNFHVIVEYSLYIKYVDSLGGELGPLMIDLEEIVIPHLEERTELLNGNRRNLDDPE